MEKVELALPFLTLPCVSLIPSSSSSPSSAVDHSVDRTKEYIRRIQQNGFCFTFLNRASRPPLRIIIIIIGSRLISPCARTHGNDNSLVDNPDNHRETGDSAGGFCSAPPQSPFHSFIHITTHTEWRTAASSV